MKFQPSAHSYGGDAPAGTTSQDYTQAAVAARSFLFGDDVRQEAAKVQAQINNLVATRDALPKALRPAVQGRINVLEAQLTALKAQAAEEQANAQSTVDTRQSIASITNVATVMAVVGVAVVGLMGWNLFKSSQLLQAKIEHERRT